jgi:UDP-2,4-diacetamido-2,4,6-trideoxy-beta-L-altropyranose hydrolase
VKVLFRVDASANLGTGHLMRCAALALRLQNKGVEIHFACIHFSEALISLLRSRGYFVQVLSNSVIDDWQIDLYETQVIAKNISPVDLLVVDHYFLSYEWEHGMRHYARRILIVDDLANRVHDCDILVDQNLHENALHRYDLFVPKNTKQFHGPRFAFLHPEFDNKSLQRLRDGRLNNLLVFFGGVDQTNQCHKVIDALQLLEDCMPETKIVLGAAYPKKEAVHLYAKNIEQLIIIDHTDLMPELVSRADLAIGTCGVAAWERCVLGLPSLVVVTAENQREDAQILDYLGAVRYLGNALDVTAAQWAHELSVLKNDPKQLQKMSARSLAVMKGREEAILELEVALL